MIIPQGRSTLGLDILQCLALSSVQFSRSVMSDSLRPHELQHARPPCPSPTPGVYSDSCLSSQWCHSAISSSVVPLALYSHNYNTKIIHQNRMSISLKVKELGGDSLSSRGACLIINPLVNPILREPWGGTEESIITIMIRCSVKA